MAERRLPGFNVALGFYDSDEVLSIPRKIRAAAIGVWTLCGSYSANQLNDGYVSAEKLKALGCTDMIRTALMSTTPEPLWVNAEPEGAIQFTRWQKWQRTAVEVKTYRETEAARKKTEREAKKAARDAAKKSNVDATCETREPHVEHTCEPRGAHVPPNIDDTLASRNDTEHTATSSNTETSARTSDGRLPDVRPEDGDPKTETETESLSTSVVTLVKGGPGGNPANLPVAAKAAPADRRRGCRIPDGWQPTNDTIADMRTQFPHLDLKAIHTEFSDYWRAVPGAKGRKLDWDATWRNRVREVAARNMPARNGHAPNGVGKPTQKALGWEAAGAELLAEMERP